jgi:hypothetical protein
MQWVIVVVMSRLSFPVFDEALTVFDLVEDYSGTVGSVRPKWLAREGPTELMWRVWLLGSRLAAACCLDLSPGDKGPPNVDWLATSMSCGGPDMFQLTSAAPCSSAAS